EDMRCHGLLVEAGYRAVDLATYREINSAADFAGTSGVANVLFSPAERAGSSPYFTSDIEEVVKIPLDRFARTPDGGVSLAEAIPMQAGRYIVRADFSSDRSDNEVFAGIEADGEVIVRYHTNARFMAESYRDWP